MKPGHLETQSQCLHGQIIVIRNLDLYYGCRQCRHHQFVIMSVLNNRGQTGIHVHDIRSLPIQEEQEGFAAVAVTVQANGVEEAEEV